MLLRGFPAGSFGTNCYVVATGPGEQCIVVDPGQDATGPLEELLAEYRLTPAAVVITHGHIDHTWSVAPVCGARDIPAYIHPADRAMLADPLGGVSGALGTMLAGMTFTEPDDVRPLVDGDTVEIAGISLRVDLTPGHTPGSVVFGADDGPDGLPLLLSGDLLFAGSVGRTDLPGGSYPDLMDSLARVVLPLPDETLVCSGHGPVTSIGEERATNPFLAQLIAARGTTGVTGGPDGASRDGLPRGRGL